MRSVFYFGLLYVLYIAVASLYIFRKPKMFDLSSYEVRIYMNQNKGFQKEVSEMKRSRTNKTPVTMRSFYAVCANNETC